MEIRPLRDALVVAVIVLFSATACLLVVNQIALHGQMETMRTELEGYANAAAGLVDGDLHKQLTSPQHTDSAVYDKAIAPLVAMHRRVPKISYLYSFIERDGALHFVLDTATRAGQLDFDREMEASSVMDLYESESPEEDALEAAAVREGRTHVTRDPVTDRFGTFLSGLAPILDSNGNAVGAVGVDLDVSRVMQRMREVWLATLAGFGVAVVVSGLVGLFVFSIRKRALQSELGRLNALSAQQSARFEQELLIQALGEVVYHHDLVDDVITYGGNCEGVLGLSPDQMERDTAGWLGSIHPEDLPRVRKALDTAIQQQSIFEVEYRVKDAQDCWAWVSDRGVLTFGNEGSPLSMDGVMLDISERRQSDERFRTIFEGSTEPHMLVDKDGVIDCNSAAVELLGYSDKREIIRQPLQNFWPEFQPDGRPTAEHAADLKRLTIEHGVHRMEVMKRTRLGEVIPVEVSSTYVEINGTRVLLVVWHDLRDIKKAQRELASSESKYRDLVENLDMIVFQTDCESHLTFLNPAWERLTGHPISTSLGADYRDFLESDDRDAVIKSYQEKMSGQIEYQALVFRIRRRDGRTLWVDGYCRVRRNSEGEIIGTSGTLADITDRRNSEMAMIAARDAAETANRAKSEFLAVMSHEIRTPLNGVLGFANLLSHTRLDATQQDYLRTIAGCGDALLTIIDDILDFSRMESGKFELESHSFDLRECVEQVLEVHATRAYAKGLELVSEFSSKVPRAVVGDLGRLRQVLSNLVGNSVKFTEAGEVVVRTRLAWIDRGQVNVEMSVRDTGIGIPREKLSTLFRPFVQADSSMSRRFGGAGLGLAICRRLVRAMGGEISVRSEVGKGTIFTFTVSLRRELELPLADTLESGRGRKVIIAEPNRSLLKSLTKLLSEWGMAPSACQTPEELQAALEADATVNLVMIDSGFAPAEELQSLADRITEQNIPILLIVPIGLPPSGQDPLLSTATRRVTKPIRQDSLRAAMSELFAGFVASTKGSKPSAEVDGESAALPSPVATKILLVEDNVVNQKLVERMLRNLGYECALAPDGNVAIQLCEQENFDIVFMDIQMPQLDGFETARMLREKGSEAWIIALTAHVMNEDRERCLAIGMNDFLPKPIRGEALIHCLSRFSAQRRQFTAE